MKFALYFATFALVACAEPPPPTGDISGHWYGQRWEGRSRIIWHTTLTPDGDLEIEFRNCFNGELLSRQKEFGNGRLEDGVYKTTIERVIYLEDTEEVEEENFREDELQHDYRVIKLTDELMSYADELSGESFDAVRVAEDFILACPPATLSISTDPDGRTGRDAWIIRGSNTTPDADAPTDTPVIKNPAPVLDDNLEKRPVKTKAGPDPITTD